MLHHIQSMQAVQRATHARTAAHNTVVRRGIAAAPPAARRNKSRLANFLRAWLRGEDEVERPVLWCECTTPADAIQEVVDLHRRGIRAYARGREVWAPRADLADG